MLDRDDRRRRIDFIVEGFQVLCDADGVEIHVTDYHARPLRLSWQAIEEWKTEATPGADIPAGQLFLPEPRFEAASPRPEPSGPPRRRPRRRPHR